jgi:hypothetical protein
MFNLSIADDQFPQANSLFSPLYLRIIYTLSLLDTLDAEHRMRYLSPLLLCLSLLLLAACASHPVAPSAPAIPVSPPDKAMVHVYRRAIPLGPATLSVYDGQTLVGRLISGTYFQYLADPGPRSLKAVGLGAGSIPHATSFRAGQEYYFMVYFLGNQDTGNATITQVDAATAQAVLASLKPATP